MATMTDVIMHFNRGIGYAPPAAAGFRCGWLEVVGGVPPYTVKLITGEGDSGNWLFNFRRDRYDRLPNQIGVYTAQTWFVPPCPAAGPITVRIRIVDATAKYIDRMVTIL